MKIKAFLKPFIILVLFSISISAYALWVEPLPPAPQNNPPQPINVGPSYQEKVGAIVAGGLATPVFQMTTTPVANYVLKSDAAGFGSWTDVNTLVGGGGVTVEEPWTRTGNVTHLINSGDRVGIGTSTPTQQLTITESMVMPLTLAGTSMGVVYKNGDRFIHDYKGNTFFGQNSGNFNLITQGGLTGVGANTLLSVTSGAGDTAVGVNALSSNTSGNNNVAVGVSAMDANTTGRQNVSLGVNSMKSNTTGELNVALGYGTMEDIISTKENIAVGSGALVNNVGDRNVALGRLALEHNTQGDVNVAIGYNAGFANSGQSYINTIAIGYGAHVDGSFKARIGNEAITWIGGQVNWTAASDVRFKKNVEDLDLGLDFIMSLRPVSYQMKTDTDDRSSFGFIAQEVEEVLGDKKTKLVTTENTDLAMKYMRYEDLIAPIVKAVQEQQEDIEWIRAEVETLKEK